MRLESELLKSQQYLLAHIEKKDIEPAALKFQPVTEEELEKMRNQAKISYPSLAESPALVQLAVSENMKVLEGFKDS